MTELGSAFIQLQADYIKIKDEDDVLQRQRMRWMSCTEEWIARQVQLLESLGIGAARHESQMYCGQESPPHMQAMMKQFDAHPWTINVSAASHLVADSEAPPRAPPMCMQEPEHASPEALACQEHSGWQDSEAPARAPPVCMQEPEHASPEGLGWQELDNWQVRASVAPDRTSRSARHTARMSRASQKAPKMRSSGEQADLNKVQNLKNKEKQHGAIRRTMAAFGMHVEEDEDEDEEAEEPAKTVMGRCLQRLNKRNMQRIVEHSLFDFCTCMLIFSSTLINAYEVELLAQKGYDAADKVPFFEIQTLYSFFFLVELIMRILAYRWMFFFCEDWHWNILDLTLVCMSFVDIILWAVQSEDQDDGFLSSSSKRMMRTARLIRNLRIIRMMRFFYQLRQMLRAVFGSMKTLVWLGILLVMLLYFFALCFVSSVTEFLLDEDSNPSEAERAFLRKQFGSLLSASIALFKCVTNGDSWGNYFEPLKAVGDSLNLLFIIYIVFTVFAFMNAVTSVFVDNAMQAAHDEREDLVRAKIKEKENIMLKLDALFMEADKDGSGEISKEEFQKQLDNESTEGYFKVLGIQVNDAITLFELLDENYNGAVEIHEFLRVCPRLMGPAASIEVAHAKHETMKLAHSMDAFVKYVHKQFQHLNSVSRAHVAEGDHKVHIAESDHKVDNRELKLSNGVETNGGDVKFQIGPSNEDGAAPKADGMLINNDVVVKEMSTAEAAEGCPLLIRAGVESLPQSTLQSAWQSSGPTCPASRDPGFSQPVMPDLGDLRLLSAPKPAAQPPTGANEFEQLLTGKRSCCSDISTSRATRVESHHAQ